MPPTPDTLQWMERLWPPELLAEWDDEANALAPVLAPQTMIDTRYTDGIIEAIHQTCPDAGWPVGLYTGEDKTGLQQFLNTEVPILLSSNIVETGLDGRQHICH